MAENCSFDEIDREIIKCNIQRLTTQEALEHLHSKGHQIAERTYFERKKKLKEINSNRVISAIDSILSQHFFLMDTLEFIQEDHWHDLKSIKNEDLKLKIKNSIRDNQLLISKCYENMSSMIYKQIDSYSGAGLTDRLNYSDFQNVRRKNRIAILKSNIKEPPNLFDLSDMTPDRKSMEEELKKLEAEDQKIAQDNADSQSKEG